MFEFEKKLKEESYKTYYYRLRRFYNYFQKSLSEISIQKIHKYFISFISVKKSGREAIRNTRYAIKFYYVNCLGYADIRIMSIKPQLQITE